MRASISDCNSSLSAAAASTAAFRFLRNLAAAIGDHLQLPKCSVYGHDTAAADEVAQELGISHARRA
jgi:hypothetical protein